MAAMEIAADSLSPYSSHFIITLTPALEKSALAEMRAIMPDVRIARELQNGALLVEAGVPPNQAIRAFVRSDPIFVKHIHPVNAAISLSGRRAADLPLLLAASLNVSSISPGEQFAVQCRHVGKDHDYGSKDVEVFVGSHFETNGAIPSFSDSQVEADESTKVVSIYVLEERGYVGFSTIGENLNEVPDEYRIFSHSPRKVNRAEFKLREALRKFDIRLANGTALDLGAAPGGWSRVLAEAGMRVIAVDPAELNPDVEALPNVKHLKCRAEDYYSDTPLDLVVDDMNTDPEESATSLVKMARYLAPGAYAIMTCKFVIHRADRLLENIRPILEQEYDILRIKNLFHNRMEVTLHLRRRLSS